MIAGRNFEPWIDGGYRRIAGYERFDGQPKPSDATFDKLTFDTALSVQDDDFASVTSLLHFDGVNLATTTTDVVTATTWTFSGNAALSTTQMKNGTTSFYAPTGLSEVTSTDLPGLGVGDFTVEFYFYGAANAAALHLFDFRDTDASTTAATVYTQSGTMRWYTSSADQITSTIDIRDSAWHHIAFCRASGTLRLYIDGVLDGSVADAVDYQIGTAGWVWGNYAVSALEFSALGYFDDCRITLAARYTAAFTPPGSMPDDGLAAAGGAVGDVLSGGTSGATGEIIAIATDLLSVQVTKVTGTFADGENIDNDTTGDAAITTLDGVAESESADDIDTVATLLLAAEDLYRADIQQVPGVNDIRGIWQIKDRVYAIRDNAGETAGVIHKASATGWDDTLMDMAVYVRFTGGLVEPEIGDVLDGASSSATGTIHKIIVHTGDWGTSDAAGYFALTAVTGTYTDTENLQVSAVTQAVASGGSTVFALPVGGRYTFVSENFFAGADTYRVYAAGGVGPGFEIDENDVVTPILMDLTLGDSPDENKPFLVTSWDGRLWFAFTGGSIQHSITGDPLTFNGFLGAAEFGLGEEVTSISSVSGDVMIARTRRQTHAFYKGDTYTKKVLSDRAGGILYSDEELNSSLAADDSGITNVMRVQEFGDFANATLSDLIQPYLIARKELIAGSMVVRNSNQYRILYTNGEGVIGRVRPDGRMEFGLISYPDTVHCSYSCEDENGTPNNWFGGAAGYVFQAEIGKNFDGVDIEATCRLPFNHQGQPHQRKRYRLAELELEGERAVELYMAADLSYSGTETGAHYWEDRVVGGGGMYDVDNWDQIFWDAQQFSTARFEILGTGQNLSLMFYSNSNTTDPFILQGVQLHYDIRRVQR